MQKLHCNFWCCTIYLCNFIFSESITVLRKPIFSVLQWFVSEDISVSLSFTSFCYLFYLLKQKWYHIHTHTHSHTHLFMLSKFLSRNFFEFSTLVKIIICQRLNIYTCLWTHINLSHSTDGIIYFFTLSWHSSPSSKCAMARLDFNSFIPSCILLAPEPNHYPCREYFIKF